MAALKNIYNLGPSSHILILSYGHFRNIHHFHHFKVVWCMKGLSWGDGKVASPVKERISGIGLWVLLRLCDVKTLFDFPSPKFSWIFQKIMQRSLSPLLLVVKMLTSVNLGSICTLQFLWRFYQKPIVKKTSHFNSRNLRKSRFRKHPLAGLSDGSGANSVCRGKSKGSSVCAGACVQSWSQIQHETLAPK